MSSRYIIEFKEGGVNVFETIITGGAAVVAEKAIDTVFSDFNCVGISHMFCRGYKAIL